MRRIRKIDNDVITISDEKTALSELRGAVVDSVYLETIHVIPSTSLANDVLHVLGKEADDGSGTFVRFKRRTTSFRPFGNRPMFQGGR
ncbi:hypothetical protein WT07_16855 [Burkholderia stagnalis]|nr:hypothetical protein WT07_16855 [Burkholderia stagnalis]KWE05228.1 hypothetical protein WT48_31135 [Burkholderia stagnalis]KWE06241.1 hypothetical protein WT47_16265 [Burkholderia stagnalis]KWO88057.1 hypothetical protein WU00_25445 [Burkholderia stagnalis]